MYQHLMTFFDTVLPAGHAHFTSYDITIQSLNGVGGLQCAFIYISSDFSKGEGASAW